MKTLSTTIGVWLAFSWTYAVHAGSILSTDSDPIALPVSTYILPPDEGCTVLAANSPGMGFQCLLPSGLSPALNPVVMNKLTGGAPEPISGLEPITVNSDFGSLLTATIPAENPAISPASTPPVLTVSFDGGGVAVESPQLLTPEPSEFSLLAVGLAAIAVAFRFFPRKA